MKQINLAVVGAGDWGKNLIRNFSIIANLVAICDLNPLVANNIATQYQIKNLTWQQILSSQEIDAVVIASNRGHYPLVKQALLANKHVFVEKPLANTVLQAQELCNLATSLNKKLMVGHLLHYHPGFIQLKKIWMTKLLGDFKYIYSNRLAYGKFMPEEDAILNLASHDISILLSLLGKPKSLVAFSDSFLVKNVIDQAMIRLTFSEQRHAHIWVSWYHPLKERKLVVVGSKGMLVLDDLLDWSKKLSLYHHTVDYHGNLAILKNLHPEFIPIDNPVEPLFNETKHFIECIQSNLNPKTDGLEGLEVLKVIEQVSRQIRSLNKKSTFVGI